MDIKAIRDIFDRGTVAAREDGFFISYNNNGEWESQFMTEDQKNIFLDLMSKSEYVGFRCVKGKYLKISFKYNLDAKNSIYTPKSSFISSDIDLSEGKRLLAEHFIDVNLDDEYEVFSKLEEIIDRRNAGDAKNKVSLPAVSRYKKVHKAVERIANTLRIEVEAFEPGYDSDGSFTLYTLDEKRDKMVISKGLKSCFENALENSVEFEAEFSISEGYVNLVFYT